MAEVRSPDPARLEGVRRRYRSFLTDAAPDLTVVDEFRARAGSGGEEGTLDLDVAGRSARTRGAELTDETDSVFRQMLPSIAAPDLVVHAALLEWSGRGVLCCGRPGAGKSTMARLFPDRALCDELVRVVVWHDSVEARSLPFWEARPRRLPLAAVYVLKHGSTNRRSGVSPADAVRELRRHLYWPGDGSEATAQVLGSLVRLAERVPVYRLAFVPDRSVEQLLDPEA